MTRERLPKPHRERLDKGPEVIYPPNTRFIIKHPTKNLYLRRYAYVAMKEDEKWQPLESADCFLGIGGVEKYARRMLGHNNFTIVPKAEDSANV